MRIPHDFVPGPVEASLLDDHLVLVCEICLHSSGHFNHRAPENLLALLGELFDFVVDNVMIGKVHAPPNELLKRVSKVLAR